MDEMQLRKEREHREDLQRLRGFRPGVSIMCRAMEEMRNETVLETLISLVKKGLITVTDAAAEAKIPESVFVSKMNASIK